MSGVLMAEFAIFLKFKPFRFSPLVPCCGIITAFACITSQYYYIPQS